MINLDNSISEKEMSLLSDVLKRYSIVPEKIEKVRSAYKVSCSKGVYCLKKTNHGTKKALKVMLLIEYLKGNGFNNIVKYYKTDDGRECVKLKKNIFYLTEWIEGRECNYEDLEELKKSAALLALFHIKSKGFSNDNVKIESNFKNWPSILKADMDDLLKFKRMIYIKKIKTSFDIEYYDAIDKIINQMDKSIRLLESSNYLSISKSAKQQRTLCHDSFYYQNILVDNNEMMFIIDLDSTLYDITVYDLGKFIRRLLYKSKYSWDFEFAKALIESYNEVNKLSPEEMEILLSFIIFPHKFWKLGKKRYSKMKKWNEEKYLRKLKRILKFMDKQDEFIEKYLEYYKISII
jgi:CotS family spore coat protein